MAQKDKFVHSSTPPNLPSDNFYHRPMNSAVFRGPDPISVAESSSSLFNSSSDFLFSPTAYFAKAGINVPSFPVGTIHNEPDEYDCESEEGIEALVDEAPAKPAPQRNQSKRSRAAEVHNLSEKRRRSRINEKLKALQNLIPNSNKTDKASMLDEAIEYLKQLQLQVQMLTMRNGLSLYPPCLPGVLQPFQLSQLGMGFCDGNGTSKSAASLTAGLETRTSSAFSIPSQCTNNSDQASVANFSSMIIGSGTSFGLESSIMSEPIQLRTATDEIRREDMLPHQQQSADRSKTNSLEFHTSAQATSDDLKHGSWEASVLGRDGPQGTHQMNMNCHPIISPRLEG